MPKDAIYIFNRETSKRGEHTEVAGDRAPPQPGCIKDMQEDLLDEYVTGFFRGNKSLNPLLHGALDHCTAGEEFPGVRKETCNKRGLPPPAAPAHPLQKRRDRIRRAYLHHDIQIPDIDTEFQRARAADARPLPAVERLLGLLFFGGCN